MFQSYIKEQKVTRKRVYIFICIRVVRRIYTPYSNFPALLIYFILFYIILFDLIVFDFIYLVWLYFLLQTHLCCLRWLGHHSPCFTNTSSSILPAIPCVGTIISPFSQMKKLRHIEVKYSTKSHLRLAQDSFSHCKHTVWFTSSLCTIQGSF